MLHHSANNSACALFWKHFFRRIERKNEKIIFPRGSGNACLSLISAMPRMTLSGRAIMPLLARG